VSGLLAGTTAPVQETQSLRSLSLQPTPDEYAHNVALAVEILRSKEIDKSYWRVRCAAPCPRPSTPPPSRNDFNTVSRCARFSPFPPAISDASWERRRS